MQFRYSFAISLAVHLAGIGFLVWVDAAVGHESKPLRQYTVVMVPHENRERRVVWYDSKRLEAAPEIAPAERIGTQPLPAGQKDPARRILIAQSDHPDSTRQLIREPDHPEPLPADIPTPNLVALRAIEPPPRAKPAPKQFVPPPKPLVSSPTPAAPAIAEPPPALDPSKDPQSLNPAGVLPLKFKAPARPFIPPPVQSGRGTAAASATPELTAPPSVGAAAAPAAGLQAIILGLDPGIGPPPQGSRSAQFANAPTEGPVSTGAATLSGAAIVPGVMARGKSGEAPEANPGPATSIPDRRVLKEIVLPAVNRTMSAPLRPSARVIPASVESQFSNRNVYTLVIPGPNLPEYPGDWIMWFSEREPRINNEARASISAPIPGKKYSSSEGTVARSGPTRTATVQLAAMIDRNGHVASAKVLRSTAAVPFQLEAVAEFTTWEFKPALRNGEPVDVDIVVEIPFRLIAGGEGIPVTAR